MRRRKYIDQDTLIHLIKLKLKTYGIEAEENTIIKFLKFIHSLPVEKKNITFEFIKECIQRLIISDEKEINNLFQLLKRVLSIFNDETELVNIFILSFVLTKYISAIKFPENLLNQILSIKWNRDIFLNSITFINFLYNIIKNIKDNTEILKTDFITLDYLLNKLIYPDKRFKFLTEAQKQFILKFGLKDKNNVKIILELMEKNISFTSRVVKYLSTLDFNPVETQFLFNWEKKYFIEKYFDEFEFTEKNIDRYFSFLNYQGFTLNKNFFLNRINFHKYNLEKLKISKLENFDVFIVEPDGTFYTFSQKPHEHIINFLKDKWNYLNNELKEINKRNKIKNSHR